MSNSSIEQQFTLPSKGVLYDKEIGDITVKSMTTKEEKLIYSGGAAINQKIDTLIKRCVEGLPEGLTVYDLLDADRLFLIFKIRQLSFGSKYTIPVNCESCGNVYNHTTDLNALEVTYYEGNEKEPFEITLPNSGVTIGYKMLRGKDENAIYQFRKRENNRKKNSLGDEAYEYSLARRITHIDEKEVDVMDTLEFVKDMVTMDSSAFRNDIEKNTAGINFDIEIECPQCGYLFETYLRLTSAFFRTERSKDKKHFATTI